MDPDQSPDRPRLQPFTLGDWLVDPRACHVSRGDSVVKLRAQLVDLLVCLARRAGEIALKDEILAEVWPGQFIAESGLSRCIAELRQNLQDDAQQPRYIETITKRGYRLVAPVVWLAAEDKVAEEAAKAEPEAGTPTEVAGSKATRRWWIGGAVALILIAVAIVMFVLPPPARAVLTDKDSVVLCFENHTGETLFNGALQLALAVQLEQSPFLRVVSDEHVRQTLQLMGKPPETPLARSMAAEVCEREGAKAMVVGSIARLGSRYVLGLEAVACRTGDTLAREQMQVNGKDDVLDGLSAVARRMRQTLGESLASVERYAVPIARATTASIDALRAASLGDLEWRSGRAEEAVARYREAIAFDPSFALAYARLAPPLALLGHAQQREEAVTRAYELRERTSLPERLEIEARYHQGVEGDTSTTIEAFEALKRTYPRSPVARRGLALSYALVGRYDEALAEALEGVRLEPDGSPEHAVLAQAYIHLNRFDEAKKTAEAAIAKKIDDPIVHAVLFDCAFVAGDRAAMARELAWAASHAGAEMLFLEFQAENAIYAGKLREARSVLQRYETVARERSDEEEEAYIRLVGALFEALYGQPVAAAAIVRDVLSRPVSNQSRLRAATILAFAGAANEVEGLLKEAEGKAHLRGDSWRQARWISLAMVENNRGHPDRAIKYLEALVPQELGIDYGFLPVIVRGQAYLLARNGTAAIAEFEKVLAHRGVDPTSEMIAIARLGIARGHALAGQAEASRRAYEELLAQLRDADPDLPLLALARREYAALPR